MCNQILPGPVDEDLVTDENSCSLLRVNSVTTYSYFHNLPPSFNAHCINVAQNIGRLIMLTTIVSFILIAVVSQWCIQEEEEEGDDDDDDDERV